MWKVVVKENLNDVYIDYSLSWEADSREQLVSEYAEHLAANDKFFINKVDELYQVGFVHNNEVIYPASSAQKWDFEDDVNEELRRLHDQYQAIRIQDYEQYDQYRYDTFPA